MPLVFDLRDFIKLFAFLGAKQYCESMQRKSKRSDKQTKAGQSSDKNSSDKPIAHQRSAPAKAPEKKPKNSRKKPEHKEPTPLNPAVIAAIDLGTNSCRLLVANTSGDARHVKWAYNDKLQVIDVFSRSVKLGENVAQTSLLSEGAMRRTLSSLKSMARKLKQHQVSNMRAIATQACRMADNSEEFLHRVKQETNIDFEIITTTEEARLAVQGLTGLYDSNKDYALVFDIGGGSTQIMWVDIRRAKPKIIDTVSMPLGVVSLTDTVGLENLQDKEFRISVNFIKQQFLSFEQRNDIASVIAQGRVQTLGTSGTITTICAIHKNLHRYNRMLVDGECLTMDDIVHICDNMRKLDLGERIKHPCLGQERAPLMVAGCIILTAICEQWPTGDVRIADRSLREGILYDLLNESQQV